MLPREPYRLTLRDRRGDPLAGGAFVFDIQGVSAQATEPFASSADGSSMRQVLVSLHPIGGERPSCEVVVRAPIAWAHDLNAAPESGA